MARPMTATASIASCEANAAQRAAIAGGAGAKRSALTPPSPHRRHGAHHRRADRVRRCLGARELRDDAALAHDQHAVAHAEHFGQFAGDHQDGDALRGEFAHQPMDLRLGADVDAARRLVEDQQLRLVGEPFAEHDLLLVAAGKPARDLLERTRPDVELLDAVVGEPALGGAVDEAEAGQPWQARRARNCRSTLIGRTSPWRAAILRHIGDAERARLGRASGSTTGWPASRISPLSAGVTPNIVCASSLRPEPTRPASPTISPARTVRLTPRVIGLAHEIAHLQHRRADRHLDLRKQALDRRPTIMCTSSPELVSAIARVPI